MPSMAKCQVGSMGLTTAARRRCCPRSQPVAIACSRLGLLPSVWAGKPDSGSPSRRLFTLAFCQSRADGNCHLSGNSVGYCQGKNKLHSLLLPLSLSLPLLTLFPRRGQNAPQLCLTFATSLLQHPARYKCRSVGHHAQRNASARHQWR